MTTAEPPALPDVDIGAAGARQSLRFVLRAGFHAGIVPVVPTGKRIALLF